MKLILEAYAVSDHGDGPSWAVVELTPALVDRIEVLSLICSEHRLQSVSVAGGPDEWDCEDELRLRYDALVVHGSSFWYEAQPKYNDYEVETRLMEVQTLRKALAGESNGELVIEGDHVFQNETVRDSYTEWLGEQVEGEE